MRPIYLFFPATSTTYYADAQKLTVGTGTGILNVKGLPVPLLNTNFYRQVTLTTDADLTGLTTFTITGQTASGIASETIAGFNVGTATSVNFYLNAPTITYTQLAATSAANVSAGTGDTGTSVSINLDNLCKISQVAVQCVVTGTINYNIYQTLDNVIHPLTDYLEQVPTPSWFNVITPGIGATTSLQGTLIQPVNGCQIVVNSSSGGSLRGTILQQGK